MFVSRFWHLLRNLLIPKILKVYQTLKLVLLKGRFSHFSGGLFFFARWQKRPWVGGGKTSWAVSCGGQYEQKPLTQDLPAYHGPIGLINWVVLGLIPAQGFLTTDWAISVYSRQGCVTSWVLAETFRCSRTWATVELTPTHGDEPVSIPYPCCVGPSPPLLKIVKELYLLHNASLVGDWCQ